MTAGFAVIPRSFLLDREVPSKAKLVYLVLTAYADGDRSAWPSHKRIAADASISVSTVKRSLELLRDRGLVEWEVRRNPNGGRSSNFYRLMIDPAPASATPTQGDPTPLAPTELPLALTDPTLALTDLPLALTERRTKAIERKPMNNTSAPPLGDAMEHHHSHECTCAVVRPIRPRRRDLIFEALLSACSPGTDPKELPKAERGRYNRATADLRQMGHAQGIADETIADLVGPRAEAYGRVYPNAPLTVTALVANWAKVRSAATVQRREVFHEG